YNATTFMRSPWLPMGSLDVPIETAGERGYRRSHAAHISEAARLNILTAAWQVRSNLRTRLIELVGARQRQALLASQVSFQGQALSLLEGRLQAGAISRSELTLARVALERARLDLTDAQRQA